MKILAVDVGLNTGLAYFTSKKDLKPEVYLLRVIKITVTHEDKITKLSESFYNFIRHIRKEYRGLDLVLIEGVEFYGNSLKSVTATRRGDLFFLAYLVGAYCNVCVQHDLKFKIQTFNQWGGQMTAEVINNRVKRAIGKTYKTQHENDAVAMGLSYYGNKYFREVR